MVTDYRVRILMKQINQSKILKTATAKAGMSEKTARKYRRLNKLPSQCKPIHDWKTREDTFENDWPWLIRTWNSLAAERRVSATSARSSKPKTLQNHLRSKISPQSLG